MLLRLLKHRLCTYALLAVILCLCAFLLFLTWASIEQHEERKLHLLAHHRLVSSQEIRNFKVRKQQPRRGEAGLFQGILSLVGLSEVSSHSARHQHNSTRPEVSRTQERGQSEDPRRPAPTLHPTSSETSAANATSDAANRPTQVVAGDSFETLFGNYLEESRSFNASFWYFNERVAHLTRTKQNMFLTKRDLRKFGSAGLPPTFGDEYPSEPEALRWSTCAVVGTRPNPHLLATLRNLGLGAHIDAHDAVFRVGNDPVAGFENDVGFRTTVRYVGSLKWTLQLVADLVRQLHPEAFDKYVQRLAEAPDPEDPVSLDFWLPKAFAQVHNTALLNLTLAEGEPFPANKSARSTPHTARTNAHTLRYDVDPAGFALVHDDIRVSNLIRRFASIPEMGDRVFVAIREKVRFTAAFASVVKFACSELFEGMRRSSFASSQCSSLSTYAVALLTALQHCDSVDVYGYTPLHPSGRSTLRMRSPTSSSHMNAALYDCGGDLVSSMFPTRSKKGCPAAEQLLLHDMRNAGLLRLLPLDKFGAQHEASAAENTRRFRERLRLPVLFPKSSPAGASASTSLFFPSPSPGVLVDERKLAALPLPPQGAQKPPTTSSLAAKLLYLPQCYVLPKANSSATRFNAPWTSSARILPSFDARWDAARVAALQQFPPPSLVQVPKLTDSRASPAPPPFVNVLPAYYGTPRPLYRVQTSLSLAERHSHPWSRLHPFLPPYPTPQHWGSCALVGHDGGLLGKRSGLEIDAHDTVLRFGWAPTAGFEDDVGKRTSVRFLGFAEAQSALFEKHRHTLIKQQITEPLNRSRRQQSFASSSPVSPTVFLVDAPPQHMLRLYERFPELLQHFLIYNRQVSFMTLNELLHGPLRMKWFGEHPYCRPSSGLGLLIHALPYCSTLTVYGMARETDIESGRWLSTPFVYYASDSSRGQDPRASQCLLADCERQEALVEASRAAAASPVVHVAGRKPLAFEDERRGPGSLQTNETTGEEAYLAKELRFHHNPAPAPADESTRHNHLHSASQSPFQVHLEPREPRLCLDLEATHLRILDAVGMIRLGK